MNSPYAPILEKTLIAIIALIFFSPLFLTVVTYNVEQTPSWAQWLNHDWLRNRTLRGVRIDPPVVSFSWPALRHAQYQHSVASRFNVNFTGREFLIRLTNELNYRLFRISSIHIDPLALGKDDWLFEKGFLREYSFGRPSKAELEPMVRSLASLQEECRNRGIAFAILITPSKASTYSEKIPAAWKRRCDPRVRAYPIFRQLLDEHRIDYVDGVDLTARAKANAPVPVFPRGGIHWSDYGCFISSNQLVALLRKQGLNIRPLEVKSLRISEDPQGSDADIYSLMNLFLPWHYTVGTVAIKPIPATDKALRPNLVFVGDSFMWQTNQRFRAMR